MEDEVGGPQPLPRWRLLQWLRQKEGLKCPLSGVFLNCCDSEGIAGHQKESKKSQKGSKRVKKEVEKRILKAF